MYGGPFCIHTQEVVMTMSVNIAHRGPDSYVSIVTVEDRVFDHGAQEA